MRIFHETCVVSACAVAFAATSTASATPIGADDVFRGSGNEIELRIFVPGVTPNPSFVSYGFDLTVDYVLADPPVEEDDDDGDDDGDGDGDDQAREAEEKLAQAWAERQAQERKLEEEKKKLAEEEEERRRRIIEQAIEQLLEELGETRETIPEVLVRARVAEVEKLLGPSPAETEEKEKERKRREEELKKEEEERFRKERMRALEWFLFNGGGDPEELEDLLFSTSHSQSGLFDDIGTLTDDKILLTAFDAGNRSRQALNVFFEYTIFGNASDGSRVDLSSRSAFLGLPAIPLPASWAALLAALGLLGGWRATRRRA